MHVWCRRVECILWFLKRVIFTDVLILKFSDSRFDFCLVITIVDPCLNVSNSFFRECHSLFSLSNNFRYNRLSDLATSAEGKIWPKRGTFQVFLSKAHDTNEQKYYHLPRLTVQTSVRTHDFNNFVKWSSWVDVDRRLKREPSLTDKTFKPIITLSTS